MKLNQLIFVLLCFPCMAFGQTVERQWQKSQFYDFGSTVTHKGGNWRATFANIGVEPGSFGQNEWVLLNLNAEGAALYDRNAIYDEGNIVAFGNAIWVANVSNTGEEPGVSNAWSPIAPRPQTAGGSGPENPNQSAQVINSAAGYKAISAWQRNVPYTDPDAIVEHLGFFWSLADDNLTPPIGLAPLDDGCYWTLTGIQNENSFELWSPDAEYNIGDAVVFDDFIWMSLSETRNIAPGQNAYDWIAIKGVDTGLNEWRVGAFYQLGSLVRHNDQNWINIDGQNRHEPGAVVDPLSWALYAAPTATAPIQELWLASTGVFNKAGLLYSFDGEFWVTLGAGPELELPILDDSGWRKLDLSQPIECALLANQLSDILVWDPSTIYNAIGTIVKYGNKYYRNTAAIYSSTPPPEDTASWEDISEGAEIAILTDTTSVYGQKITNWNRTTSYQADDTVIYNNRQWLAISANFQSPPGSSRVWQPVELENGEQWNTYFIYQAGALVSYDGVLWKSLFYNEAAPPGSSDAWMLLGIDQPVVTDGQAWNAQTIYTAERNFIVTHKNRQWKNNYWTQGDEPGRNVVWQPVRITPDAAWEEFTIYLEGDTVLYNGQLWKAAYYTQGQTPGTSPVWIIQQDPNDPSWNTHLVYDDPGTIVTHNGREWVNSYWTQGDEPGTHVVWQPVTIEPGAVWEEFTTYATGQTVAYNGQIWSALYQTQGEAPGSGGAWSVQP